MSKGDLILGQHYLDKWNVVIPFSQQVMDNKAAALLVGTNLIDVDPIDGQSSRVRRYDIAEVGSALDAISYSFPSTANLRFPNILTNISILEEHSSENGSSSESGSGQGLGTTWSWQRHSASTAQAEAAISYVGVPSIVEVPSKAPSIRSVFVLAFPITLDKILTKLATEAGLNGATTINIGTSVFTWAGHGMVDGDRVVFTTTGVLPTGSTVGVLYYVVNSTTNTFQVALTSGGSAVALSGSQSGTHTTFTAPRNFTNLKPQSVTIVSTGQRKSVRTNNSISASASNSSDGSSTSNSTGAGVDKSVGISITKDYISPTLHGNLGGGGNLGVIVSCAANNNAVNVSGRVVVVGGGATNPSSIPLSGKLFVDMDSEILGYNRVIFHAETVLASDLV